MLIRSNNDTVKADHCYIFISFNLLFPRITARIVSSIFIYFWVILFSRSMRDNSSLAFGRGTFYTSLFLGASDVKFNKRSFHSG